MALGLLLPRPPQSRPRLVSRTLPERLRGLPFPPGGGLIGIYADTPSGEVIRLQLRWPTPTALQDSSLALLDLGFKLRPSPWGVFTLTERNPGNFVWDAAHRLSVASSQAGADVELCISPVDDFPDISPLPSLTPPPGLYPAAGLFAHWQDEAAYYVGEADFDATLNHWLDSAQAQGWTVEERACSNTLGLVRLRSVDGRHGLLTLSRLSTRKEWQVLWCSERDHFSPI